MKPLNQNTYNTIPRKPYWTSPETTVLNSLYRATRYAMYNKAQWDLLELNQALKGGLAPKI